MRWVALLAGLVALAARPELVSSAPRADAARRAGGVRAGLLSPPSDDPPAVIARRALAAATGAAGRDLAPPRLWPLRDGSLVVFAGTAAGAPVVGGGAAVRIDGQGRVRWLIDRRRDPSPPGRAVLGRDAAIARAVAALSPTPPWRAIAARLVVRAPPVERPRLSWQVDVATPAELQVWRAFVAADDGTLLAAEPLGHAARADVYLENPVVTPRLSRVELDLPVGASQLGDDDLVVDNCPDEHACRETSPTVFLHACTIRPVAAADAGGDFLLAPPADDRDPADPFAEVQAYYHASHALAVVRALAGSHDVIPTPLRVIANYKPIDVGSYDDCKDDHVYDGDAPLGSFNNAYFTPSGEGLGVDFDGPTLAFGQGSTVDFAYDGDVVAHELGHAVIAALSPSLSRGAVDRFGFDASPAALHEGLADLVTMMVTDDPAIGEYAGSGFGDGEPPRSLDSHARCPDDLRGSVHGDSLVFTGAVWQARAALSAARRVDFDRAVLVAWRAIDAFTDFDQLGQLLVAELDASVGRDAAASLSAALAERGVPGDCGGRIVDGARGVARARLYADYDDERGARPLPGPFQLHLELDHRLSGSLELTIDTFDSPVPDLAGAVVLLKAGGDPIVWRASGDELVHDADREVPLVVDADRRAHASFDGRFAPGQYHAMLVNHGIEAQLYGVHLSSLAPVDDGCQVGGRGAASLAAALLLASLLSRAWRRGRRRPRG